MNVIVSGQAWKRFLRRARTHHPHEHVEACWGIETVDSFRIVKFHRIRLTRSSSCRVDYTAIEIGRQKSLAIAAGLQFLGTVHTHPRPYHDTVPSTLDYHSGVKDGERMLGIVRLVKPVSPKRRWDIEACWWLPQLPMKFTLLA